MMTTTTKTDVRKRVGELEGDFFSRSLLEYPAFIRHEAEWVRDRLSQVEPDPSDPEGIVNGLSDEEFARLTLAVTSIEVRDVAWALMTAERVDIVGRVFAELMDKLTGGDPAGADKYSVQPAALLAFAAWRTGRLRMALMAATVAVGLDPECRLAVLVGVSVVSGVDPSDWDEGAPKVDELAIFSKE